VVLNLVLLAKLCLNSRSYRVMLPESSLVIARLGWDFASAKRIAT
jgi:hypothetical protein